MGLEFDSIEALDRAYDEEFSLEGEVEDSTVDEQATGDNATEDEETDTTEVETEGETEVETETEDGEGEETEDEEGIKGPAKPSETKKILDTLDDAGKQAYNWKEMKRAKSDAEAKAKELDAKYQRDHSFMETLANASGFATVEAYQEAMQKQLDAKQAKEKGIPEEVYKELKETRKIAETSQAELARARDMAKVERFNVELSKYVADYNLTEDDQQTFFGTLKEQGYTDIQDLMQLKNPSLLIKGALTDILVEKSVQKRLKSGKGFKELDTEELGSTKPATKTVDELEDAEIAKEMKRLMTERGY